MPVPLRCGLRGLVFIPLAQAVCRNSFQSLMKPDITKVELLRDVESKQDLIVRLVAHDISDPFHRGMQHLDEPESEERVLREDRSVFFEAPFMPPPQDEDKEPEVSEGLGEGETAWHVSCAPLPAKGGLLK